MCSILGVSFAVGSEINRHKLATSLLSAGEVRGRDASGFAWVSPNGDGIYKKDLPGGKLHVGRLPSDASAMILHTRASTHGSPKDNDNNHPVLSPSGDIRLVHNGVIYNHEDIRSLLGKVGKGLPEVDSSVIPAIIEEFGLDATSELGGYASAAWFDRETDDTIHLARFKQSTVFFAQLWDGSMAFASTADILAKALQRVDIPWFGGYPAPFAQMSEGEYFQIMNGDIITESEVEWNTRYINTGRSYYNTTQGVSQPTTTTTHPAATPKSAGRGFSASQGSEDQPKALVVMNAEDYDDEDDVTMAQLAGSEKSMRDIVSMVFSGEDESGLTPEEYARWERTGSIFETPEDEGDPESDASIYDSTDQQFFTMTHDGDYATYTTLSILMASLRWHAGLTGEDHLVGPEEGDLRWINHFADIGALSDDGSEEYSWVKDEGEFQLYENHVPGVIRAGITKLRQLVGS